TMFALTLGFLPLILDEAADISLAQRARCIEGRRNPVYRLLVFVLALLRRTFKRADGVAMAMEARCFTGRATPCALKSRSLDWFSLALAAGLTAAVILPGL
ncbi:MAG TPA: energy-coupling factor transporter transmembrane component T, partial [Spirochaetia bacterium]|nr:energy-coupling factor transporter transmembrane component T [Spirochaetia bacterium]